MENCRKCGIEIENDITNPLMLCDDCFKKETMLCENCEQELKYRMFELETDRQQLVERLVCINFSCPLKGNEVEEGN